MGLGTTSKLISQKKADTVYRYSDCEHTPRVTGPVTSIRCWLLVCCPTGLGCWPTSLGWWYAGPALGAGCRCAGRPAWDAGVLAEQPGMLVC
ncbi:uncharacterized [Tachysurus ichikawai]